MFNFKRNWGKYHTLKNLSMALSIEAGELMDLMKWKTDDEIKAEGTEFYKKMRDEIADCFIYLLIICYTLELNEELIKMIINNKIKDNGIKYPVGGNEA